MKASFLFVYKTPKTVLSKIRKAVIVKETTHKF